MAKKKTFADLMAEAALQGMPEDKTTADLLNVPLSRGAILPLTEYLDRAEFDLSSGLPGAFADAVTAPARAARGEISEDQQIPEAFNFAGNLTLGSLLAPRPGGSVGMGGRAAKGALDMSEAARMARAKEMGFDTASPLYHYSQYDFNEFVPNSYRGASFFADTPEGALRGASAGGMEHPSLGGPTTNAPKGGAAYYPVYAGGKIWGKDAVPDWFFDKEMTYGNWRKALDDWQSWEPPKELGLTPDEARKVKHMRREALDSFAEAVPESEFAKYAGENEANLPLKFDETYRPKAIGYESFEGVNNPPYDLGTGEALRQALSKMGYSGAKVSDESGIATAIMDPSRIRSVNAAFDPEKAHLANLLAANAKTGAAVPLATRALEAQQPQGIRAFHGSPHDFDKFDMSKIGTGEGAQAYGHGLYFAENEGVAKAYREALSDKTDALTPVTFEGRKIGPSAPGISGEDLAARFAAQSGGNAKLARAHIRGMYNDPKNLPPAHKEAMRLLTEQPERFASAKYLEPGHMYEVNIKADPESFIDYDIPLGQQSEAVRRALDEAGLMPYTVVDQAGNRLDFSKGMPKAEAERFAAAKGGRAIPKDDADFDAVRKAQMMTGRGDAAQADIATALREAGIPGVRYLDQMSRGAGEGSSNYVVFDDAIIDIVKKYGIAGLALLQAAGYGTNEGEETQ